MEASEPGTARVSNGGRRAPVMSAAAVAPASTDPRRARRPRHTTTRRPSTHTDDARRLRVALLAPPWLPVPPPGYGGIECVISALADGLVRRGHRVTLLAAPGSRSSAHVVELLERAHPEAIGQALFEIDHVTRALEYLEAAADRGMPFDIVHDHCSFSAFALADRIEAPLLHTLHGPFTPDTSAFYRRHARKAWVSALSAAQRAQAPAGLRCAGVVPNPIDVAAWPFQRHKQDYVLWVGRMAPEKGPHRAIRVARAAGRKLVLAGPVQPGQRAFFDAEVAPHIDGDRVRYVEEVGGARKAALFAGAAALLMPIRWPEPFGMVMIEAMASGTPVVAFPEGAAGEVVLHRRSGYLVADESEMAAALGRLGDLDPEECRAVVAERFDVAVVARLYETAYRRVIEARRSDRSPVS
jgi:glycosyltransferase involved in cell wall biosynthesis